jgi:hypothetical protein
MEKEFIIYYYLIGLGVSLFNIWFYRYSKWKTPARRSDSLLALLGVLIWPLQIVLKWRFVFKRLSND